MLQLIVFAGLPGVGKSEIAEAVGRKLGIPVFAKDWLEAALLRCALEPALPDTYPLGFAGYELLTVLAERQLRLGQSAILDSVASMVSIRTAWRQLAASQRARWRVIECVCSDEAAHRDRLMTRRRGIPGWHELAWADVERVAAYYAPWDQDRLVLDACRPLAENIAAALDYLKG